MFFKDRLNEETREKAAQRGVIYARYSSDMQETSESIEVQLKECQKYALDNDVVLVREPYIDRAQTGTSTQNRKAYQGLLALAQTPERDFDVILTFHTSRWGRGIESEIDEYLIEKCGVKIISVSQPFTASDAIESVFMKGIIHKIDAYYSMQTSKYTHAYQSSNARNGFKNGGSAPDGYLIAPVSTGKRDKHGKEKMKARLALDASPGKFDLTEQPRHKLPEFVFTNAYQGRGLRWLAKEVYRQGWRCRYTSEQNSASTIRMWLINPTYTGYMTWNRVKFVRNNGRRGYRHNPISKWVYSEQASHPAIVAKDLFEAVAEKFMRRVGRCKGRPRADGAIGDRYRDSARYLVTGLMECGLCGANYVAGQNKRVDKNAVQVYMSCNTKMRYGKKKCPSVNINLASAEGAVMDALLNRLLNEAEIKQFIQAFNEYMEEDTGRLGDEAAAVLKQKAKTEREIANIKRSIMEGADSVMFSRELQERKRTLDELQPKLALIEGAGAVPKLEYNPAKLGIWTANLREMIVKADFDQRRELVRRFVKKVVVRPDKTALMTWDLPAVVSFFDGKEVPGETLDLRVLTSNGCGGWI